LSFPFFFFLSRCSREPLFFLLPLSLSLALDFLAFLSASLPFSFLLFFFFAGTGEALEEAESSSLAAAFLPRSFSVGFLRFAAFFAPPPLALPALAVAPSTARAAATGGGFTKESGISTQGGGPPSFGEIAKLTKGVPGEAELKRLSQGYARLQYLVSNWEKETTVCIKGCKGAYENCGCARDPIIVQSYMGYKSMNDPLFKAGDLMLRASDLVDDKNFDKYTGLVEKWNKKADSGNAMAYVSSWGEANPGGGQSEINRYLEKSRKEVLESAQLLKDVMDMLGVPVLS